MRLEHKKYTFALDKLLSGSVRLQVIALIVFTVLIVLSGAVLMLLLREAGTVGEGAWWAFLRITDPGHLAVDQRPLVRIAGAVVAVSGWVIFGLLISIFSTGIQTRLSELQRGRTFVPFEEHTLVLGWNPTVFSVLEELAMAEEKRMIVIMAMKPVDEMSAYIKRWCRDTEKNVICRSGNPESANDLAVVNAAMAEEIIVLNDFSEPNPLHADASVLKTILAVREHRDGSGGVNRRTRVVAEFMDPLSVKLVDGVIKAGRERAEKPVEDDFVVFPAISVEILGKLLVQCALQPGLSKVYRELFSFRESDQGKSSEIYVVELKRPGRYNRLVLPKGIIIGYRRKGEDVVLNPDRDAPDTLAPLQKGDLIYCVADRLEDLAEGPVESDVAEGAEACGKVPSRRSEVLRVLVVGDGHKAQFVVKDLAGFLPEGSTIVCVNEVCQKQKIPRVRMEAWPAEDIQMVLSELCDQKIVEYDSIIVAEDIREWRYHDARTLMMLAGLNIGCEEHRERPRVVVEMMDRKNIALAEHVQADDVIIGMELSSSYMVQLVKEPLRYEVFSELLSSRGNEIYLKPLKRYAQGREVTFLDVMATARQINKTAIGMIRVDGECTINPEDKHQRLDGVDRIVVLATDEAC